MSRLILAFFAVVVLFGCGNQCKEWDSTGTCGSTSTPPPPDLYRVLCPDGTCDPTFDLPYYTLRECFTVHGNGTTWNPNIPQDFQDLCGPFPLAATCTVHFECPPVPPVLPEADCVQLSSCNASIPATGTLVGTSKKTVDGCVWDFAGVEALAKSESDAYLLYLNGLRTNYLVDSKGNPISCGTFGVPNPGPNMHETAYASCDPTGTTCAQDSQPDAYVIAPGQTLGLHLTPGTSSTQSWVKFTDSAHTLTVPLHGSIGLKQSTSQMIVGLVRGPSSVVNFGTVPITNLVFGINSPITYTGTSSFSVAAAAGNNKTSGKAHVNVLNWSSAIPMSSTTGAGTITGTNWTYDQTKTYNGLIVQIHLRGTTYVH